MTSSHSPSFAAYAPTGARIIGVLERVLACREVTFEPEHDGGMGFDRGGRYLAFFPDAEASTHARRDGRTLFLDDRHEEWSMSDLTFREETA